MNLRSLLGRKEQRGINSPGHPWQPVFPFTYGSIGRSYQDIDPQVGETALQSVAYAAGVDLIASIVSELPLDVYSGTGSQRKKRGTPGYLDDPAGDGYGRADWIYQWITSWMLRGNAMGQKIDVGPTGMIRQVDIYHPDTVSVSQVDGEIDWRVSGQPIPSERIYHKRVNPVPGTIMGRSVVQSHANMLGLNLASAAFGRTWFQDGGHPGGILTNSEIDLDNGAIRTAKDRFMAALFGAREPIVLGRGWKFEQIQVSPEESQFLQTQKWTAAECAHILGPGVAEVLGYETGSSMVYANVVDRDVTLLKYSVGKWVNRIERLFAEWLPRPQYIVLDRDAFLETSALQRWQLNKTKLETGAYTINMVRDKENDPPVKWGDEPFALFKPTAAPAPPEGDPAANPPTNQPPTGA